MEMSVLRTIFYTYLESHYIARYDDMLLNILARCDTADTFLALFHYHLTLNSSTSVCFLLLHYAIVNARTLRSVSMGPIILVLENSGNHRIELNFNEILHHINANDVIHRLRIVDNQKFTASSILWIHLIWMIQYIMITFCCFRIIKQQNNNKPIKKNSNKTARELCEWVSLNQWNSDDRLLFNTKECK